MKQLLQELDTGKTTLIETPVPKVSKGHVLIQTQSSLVSIGTEKMLVNFSRSNLVQKAMQQPEKVKMVLDKVKTDGLAVTYEAVRSKLKEPLPLGYSNVGVVLDVGEGVTEFSIGDRVVSNGSHAEVVHVPKNLCAKIPDNVSCSEASFVVVSSIGLQAVRLAKPTIGENFVVSGVGLIGLLTIQILRANGCRVLALDYDSKKLEVAKKLGAEICDLNSVKNPVDFGMRFSHGQGVDGVIITASTQSSEPIETAARMSRKRGRIIMLGVTGMQLNRADFYEKELSFQVSCSYGPGRYDPLYEQKGIDYPLGFVRWTEKRNFEAILTLMENKLIKVDDLMTKEFDFLKASDAFDYVMAHPNSLGIILNYQQNVGDLDVHQRVIKTQSIESEKENADVKVGVLGAGNYSKRVLIPSIKAAGFGLETLASTGGVSASVHARKLGFKKATTDEEEIFNDTKINTVFVVTRHDSHSDLVVKSLQANKHVFVEKPLALNLDEINYVREAYESKEKPSLLMVGFNRRFSPLVQEAKELLREKSAPMMIHMSVNAGFIDPQHWTQDPKIGGGRIIGEACHFIDLARYFSGSMIEKYNIMRMADSKDCAIITLSFQDGSIASIHYYSNGHSSYPKEKIEISSGGGVITIDNFISLKAYGFSRSGKKLWKQNKGQVECCQAFLESIKKGKPSPISYPEIIEVASVTTKLAEKLFNDE